MQIKSLPHFAHNPIGKTTHKKGKSYHHVNYITRDDACAKTIAQHMPADRDAARSFFEKAAYQQGVPTNARIADTLIIALPLELTNEQRYEAIRNFMEKIGHGRIAWLAAFHEKGKDTHNPHCHIIFRDADIETGRKVIGTTTSAKDVKEAEQHGWRVPPRMTTKDLRVAWCEHLNNEMERHGLDIRFDHRRLKERGIDRLAEIHVGPKADSMAKNERSFDSQDRKRGDHVTIYTLLDAGSRRDYNERIKAANQKRSEEGKGFSASKQEDTERALLRDQQRTQRKGLYAEQKRDRAALREAHHAEKREHQRWGRALYAEARQKAFDVVKGDFAEKWRDVRKMRDTTHRDDTAASLKILQKQHYKEKTDLQIEAVRPVKNEAWQSLMATQGQERDALKQRHGEEQAALSRQQIAERHALHERWQQTHLGKQTDRINAKFETNQSMPAVQTNAVAMIKLRAKEQGHSNGSDYVICHFSERARAEAANLNTIRYGLNAERQSNQLRAAEPLQRRSAAGQIAAARQENRSDMIAQRQAREQTDKQSAIGQALANGQTLSTADQAVASPKTKAEHLNEQRPRSRREELWLAQVRENDGKNRNSGRER